MLEIKKKSYSISKVDVIHTKDGGIMLKLSYIVPTPVQGEYYKDKNGNDRQKFQDTIKFVMLDFSEISDKSELKGKDENQCKTLLLGKSLINQFGIEF